MKEPGAHKPAMPLLAIAAARAPGLQQCGARGKYGQVAF